MEIKVKYIETPPEIVKVRRIAGSKGGKIGGKAKVAKGFAKMDKQKLSELSKKALANRWGK
jgi:hypothetical protein